MSFCVSGFVFPQAADERMLEMKADVGRRAHIEERLQGRLAETKGKEEVARTD